MVSSYARFFMHAKWMFGGPCLLGACLAAACSSGKDGTLGNTSQAVTSPAPVNAPAIEWTSIGAQGPTPIPIGTRAPTDPLPHADVVVLTWTATEWSALDHVFVNSASSRTPTDKTWQGAWSSYTRNASQYTSSNGTLWGSFQLVQVTGQTVLLFKSNAHLSFSPYLPGLRAMVQNILADSTPQRIYSIGTAGAARLEQDLGDTVVTNSAYLQMTLSQNASDPANGQTFTSSAYPSLALASSAQKLMIPLSGAATSQDLQSLFTSVFGSSSGISPSDVINAPLTNLGSPTVRSMQGVALNTSDDFLSTPGAGMAPGDGNDPYSVYETDDAVIAQAAIQANVQYASIRNISDTVVPSTTASSAPISDTLRTNWSSALYYRYGFLTSVNGALATWAAIATSSAPQSDAGAPSGGDAGAEGGTDVPPTGSGTASNGGCDLAAGSAPDATAASLVLAGLALALSRRSRRAKLRTSL
jgi:nucleoside phosphorylase